MSSAVQVPDIEAGRRGYVAEELLTLVYEDLRRLAAARMAREAPGQTLQATALVHEAWLRLEKQDQSLWRDREHFLAAAAEAMRRILVEAARRKRRLKRGGHVEHVDLNDVELALPMPSDDLLALDEALGRLAEVDSRAAEMVKLCFFVGLTQDQAARELGVSRATAERIWSFARTWIFRDMREQGNFPRV